MKKVNALDAFLNKLIAIPLRFRFITIVCAVIFIGFGVIAFQTLSIEAYPDFTDPLVRVITLYPGKSAEEVERLVTIPIEKELNGIPHEAKLRSTSIFGLSVVSIKFEENTPSVFARQQVLERLQQANVPNDVNPQLDPDASPIGEIYRYTLESKYYTPLTVKALEDWKLEKAFRQIPGVIDVTSFGGPVKTYQVNLDPGRLKAYNLSALDVFDAIQKSNATTGGNYIENNGQAYVIRALGLIDSVHDLGNVVVKTPPNGTPIRVNDVANVVLGPGIRLGQVGKNAQDDVIEGIVLMRRGENPSNVINKLYEKLPEIQKDLPQGVKLVPLYDRMELMRRTMETISHNVAEGIILVIAVLLLFLFNVRAALICACVIPLALLFAFIFLNGVHIPANLLSLGAVDFGIIVDSTVVMVEHIYHRLTHCHESMSAEDKLDVVLTSAQEIGRPILFATCIIAVAFFPIFAFDGVAGKLFRPLAFTMNFALIGAVLVSLILIPLLCWIFMACRPLKHRESPVFKAFEKYYYPLLEKCLKKPALFLTTVSIAVIISVVMFINTGTEFLPSLDEGNIWLRVTVLPTSVSLEKSVTIAKQVRSVLTRYDEVKNVVSQVGSPDDGTDPNNPSNIEFLVDLNKADTWRPQWHENKEKLVASMSHDMEAIPGILTNFSQYIQDNVDEAIAGAKGQVVIKVYGKDLTVLQKLGSEIEHLFHKVPGMVDIASDKLLGQPQYQIIVDRSAADRYGINVEDISKMVETAIGGKVATQVLDGDMRFNVMVRFSKPFRDQEVALENLLIQSPTGLIVPLSEVASVKVRTGAAMIFRSDNERVMAVKGNIRDRDLGSIVHDAQNLVAKNIKLPDGYRSVWSGQYENQQRANARLSVALPLTIMAISLLLFLAFGSWRDVLVAMTPLPLTLIGTVIALWLTKTYFSVSAGVGFIAAVGVSTQNGVVILSFIKDLVAKGIPPAEAALMGAKAKFRPVLVASIVAILGLLPAAMSNGIGSQSQKPFAIVIIGGLFTATFLTIFVLPAVYILFQAKFTPKEPLS